MALPIMAGRYGKQNVWPAFREAPEQAVLSQPSCAKIIENNRIAATNRYGVHAEEFFGSLWCGGRFRR